MAFLRRLMGQRAEPQPAAPEPEPEEPEELGPDEVVRWDGQVLQWRADTPEEEKRAIAELKLLKRQIQIDRREFQNQIRDIRVDFRSQVAGRHVLLRGGGRTGRMIRAGIQGKRRYERMQVDEEVVALERQREVLDRLMVAIDRGIMQIAREQSA